MHRTYNNQLKNYNFLENLKEGYFIDAKDQNRWKVGQVKSMNKIGSRYSIIVKFDGFSYKYNESYELPAYNKLAPFRKYSLPYTGSSYDVRREEPARSTEFYIKALNKIQQHDWLSSKTTSAQYINQFIRGDLFIFVDYILTVPTKIDIPREKIQAYKSFLLKYLTVFAALLQKVISILPELQEDGNNLDQKFIWVSPKMALLYSMTEFLFNCNSLVSKRQQRVTFIQEHCGRNQMAESANSTYNLFADKISQLHIFQKCQQLIAFKGTNRSLPWSIKKQAMILSQTLNKNFQFALPTEHRQIVQVLEYLPYLSKKHLLSKQDVQRGQVSLLIGLILGGNFQAKLLGLNQLKRLLSHHIGAKLSSLLFQQIKERRVLEFLLDNHNFNSQLFKRSLPLLEFSYKQRLLRSESHFDAILLLAKDKHELELKSFYESISRFGTFLSEEDVYKFFQKMTEELIFQEELVNLIRNYTTVVIDYNPPFKKIYMTEERQGLGVTYFWALIVRGNLVDLTATKKKQQLLSSQPPQQQLPPSSTQIMSNSTQSASQSLQSSLALTNKVIQAFALLLNNVYYAKQIQKYIILSIKSIQSSPTPESYLKVIHESLKFCKGSRMIKAIEAAQRQISIVQTAVKVLQKAQSPNGSSLSEQGVDNLFQFLQQVNPISRRGLTSNDILQMWEMSPPTKCRKQLLKFMRKYKLKSHQNHSHQKIIYKALDISQIQFILSKIVEKDKLMDGYVNVDMDHFQTIDELIVSYLHNKKIIVYNYKHTIRFKKNEFFDQDNDAQFLGMKFYLKVIENCENHEVVEKAGKRLIEIFQRPQTGEFKNTVDAKVRAWMKVTRAVSQLKRNKLQTYKLQLQQLNGRMKSLNILEPDILQIRVQLGNYHPARSHLFLLPRYTSLWKLRLLINEQFDLNNTAFEIELVQKRSIMTLQKQEDFSVAFITIPQNSNDFSVLVHPNPKQKHPHFRAIDQFKEKMSDMLAEKFYQNLVSSNTQKVALSMELLSRIPYMKSLQKAIRGLDFKTWEDILDSANMKRLQYQLSIIKNVKDLKWITAFLQKGGLSCLANILIINCAKDSLNSNNFKNLSSVLAFMLEAVKFNNKKQFPFKEDFIANILVAEQPQVSQASQTVVQQPNNQQFVYSSSNVEYLLNCFALIRQLNGRVKFINLFSDTAKMTRVLQAVLLSSSQESNIATHLIEICKVNNQFSRLNQLLASFLEKPKLLEQRMMKCRALFELLQKLIARGEIQNVVTPLQQVLLDVRRGNISESNQFQVNYLLYGFLLCLFELIKAGNQINSILMEDTESFWRYLLNQCLFSKPGGNVALCRFKSKQLRELGFRFLEMLQLDLGGKGAGGLEQVLLPLMAKGAWRKQYDWNIEPVQRQRRGVVQSLSSSSSSQLQSTSSSLQHHKLGIKNLAATCYINSLLQQLFYIQQFSHQLMLIDPDSIKVDSQNIVRQIQTIFGFLKFSDSPSYTTESLCRNFMVDGQPIDPRIQTDVDEFFHTLLDKLQSNLQKIGKKQIIFDVFRGQLSNLIIGQQCPHTSERIQHFLSIRLQIKNKKTIYQALDQFIKGEILEGENAYHCEKCDKKVKALKRVCLKNLPPVMILTLKRFEFDFDTMEKFKLNSYCSFPEMIDLLPYTKEGLQQQQEQAAGATEFQPPVANTNYQYRLKGIVIHYGVSQAGHYTSYVRTSPSDSDWYYFDDQRISEFSLKEDLQHECYGGIQQNPFGDDQDKKKNAYLLIYEKVENGHKELQQRAAQINSLEKQLSMSRLHALVEEDNTKHKVVNLLFDPALENFLFNTSETDKKMFLVYYHTVFLRNSRHSPQRFREFYSKCAQLLSDPQTADWYLNQINEAFLMEFIMHAKLIKVKLAVTSLVCQAVRKAGVNLEFLQQCFVGLSFAKNLYVPLTPFVRIFPACYFSHPQYSKYLINLNFSEVILNIAKGKEIKESNVINKVMGLNKEKKRVSDFGVSTGNFIEKKPSQQTQMDYLRDTIQSLQGGFKSGISLDDAKELAWLTKNPRTQRALASVAAKKFKETQVLMKFMESYLIPEIMNFDPKAGQEFYFDFLILLVEEFAKISDENQEIRCRELAKIYMEAIRTGLTGFLCELMLLKGLIRMLQTNLVFRRVFSFVLQQKQSKKIVSMIKDWLKDSSRAVDLIRGEKMAWWRKIKRNYVGLSVRDVEKQIILPIKETISFLNSVSERHELAIVTEALNIGDLCYYEQRDSYAEVYKVTFRMGMLVEIKKQFEDGTLLKIVNEDELIKKFI